MQDSADVEVDAFCKYKCAIEQTLLRGGDTDTNAAIVGGLIGALWGSRAIPESMAGPVIDYAWSDRDRHGRIGPDYLQGYRILPTAKALLSLAERLNDRGEGPVRMYQMHRRTRPQPPMARQPTCLQRGQPLWRGQCRGVPCQELLQALWTDSESTVPSDGMLQQSADVSKMWVVSGRKRLLRLQAVPCNCMVSSWSFAQCLWWLDDIPAVPVKGADLHSHACNSCQDSS